MFSHLKSGPLARSEIFGYAGMSSKKNAGVRIQNPYNDDFIKMNVQSRHGGKHRTSNVMKPRRVLDFMDGTSVVRQETKGEALIFAIQIRFDSNEAVFYIGTSEKDRIP